jgi:hypothetical protein
MADDPTNPPADPPKDPPADPPKKPPADPPKEPPADPPPEGFPADTKPEDMEPEEQVAYWKHRARRSEKDARKLGDVDPDQYAKDQAELERLRRESMSDREKELADAEARGRQAATKDLGPKMVRAAFSAAIGDIEDDDEAKAIQDTIGALDLAAFITDDGDVDAARVKTVAARITGGTAMGSSGPSSDYGGGRRQSSKPSGIDAGAEMFEISRKRKTGKSA